MRWRWRSRRRRWCGAFRRRRAVRSSSVSDARCCVAALLISPIALIAAGKAVAWTAERISGAQRPVVISDGPGTCRLPSDYAPLASLPKGLVLGFIDAGPMILAETPHSALAAPFHRNLKGNAAMFDVFLGRPDEAGARLAALGVDYVAFCPGSPRAPQLRRGSAGRTCGGIGPGRDSRCSPAHSG